MPPANSSQPQQSTEDIEMDGKPAPPPPWKMPQPRLPFIIWRPTILATSETYGFVAKRYPNALDLSLVAPGSGVLKIYRGVKHRDDPALRNVIAYTADGVWEECTFEADLNEKLSELWIYAKASADTAKAHELFRLENRELLTAIQALQAEAKKTEAALKTELAGMKTAIKKLEEMVK